MQLTIKMFYRHHLRIKVTLKNGMNVRYIVGHIELQILMLNQHNVLEETHKENSPLVSCLKYEPHT